MSATLDPPPGTPFPDFLKSWSDIHVAKWLSDIKCTPHVDIFKEHDIRGDILLELDHDTLKEMSISSVGDRLRILNAVKTLRINQMASMASTPGRARVIAMAEASLPVPEAQSASKTTDLHRLSCLQTLQDQICHVSFASHTRAILRVQSLSYVLYLNQPTLHPRRQPPRMALYQPGPPSLHSLLLPVASLPNRPLHAPLPAISTLSQVLVHERQAKQMASLTPAPRFPSHFPSQNLLTPTSSNNWPLYGLPADPRSGSSTLKPTMRSASPLGSHSSSRPTNGIAHGRNISFGGLGSPIGSVPATKLPPRPSTSGTTQHPYASAQPPVTGAALSPIIETFQNPSSNPSSPAFTVGRGPFHPSTHNQQLSLDDLRRKLVKFILPDEGRSCVVDVADCAGGIEVMDKVLRKFDKVAPRRKDEPPSVMSRIETDDGGLSVDGWCVYLESDDQPDNGKPLSEAELLAVCHGPPDSIKEQGLTLRRTGRTKRSKALARIFGEDPSDQFTALRTEAQRTNKAIKRASTISILSGLGVRDPEKALESLISPIQAAAKKPSKLRNFFGQRPPSELITTHLTEYFPFAEKKALRTARHSMMLRASTVGGKRESTMSLNPPLPSRFSTSTQGSYGLSSKRNSVMSSKASTIASEDPPRVSISTDDGNSVILTGDDVEKLSGIDSKPHLLPPVTFPTESLSESMEDLTGDKRLSRASSNSSKRTSLMTELRSKRDRSDTASLLTVDEITAEVENRRQSMAVDMGVEGAEDWTKVEPDIDDVTSLSEDTVFEEEDEEDEGEEEEDETGRAMTSSGGTKWIKGALIGAGSFGKVYLGMDAVNGLLMAVKQVELPTGSAPNEERKKSMLSALEREIDLLKDLSHPNIVQYLYSSVDDDFLNIFLEYVPGGSVTALLRNYGAFEEPLVKNFVRQILQGLNYLHERDIIHRDIKGANILVDNKGGIKISDFGISKRVDGNLLTGKRMNRPSLQGSVFWMAPEVVQQKAHTTAADIWSVGCLVVEMLTGEHPWAQLTQMQAIFKIGQSAKPGIPSDISTDTADFLTKTFEIDHARRPSAGELLQHAWLAIKKPVGVSSGKWNAAAKGVPTIEVTS
ncbi:Pkinase-domain-containing protein [Chiua virens]|nr:Pkinase-domain-containing protein [Chiua virens]